MNADSGPHYRQEHMLVSAGIMETRLTSLSISTADRSLIKHSKYLSARLFLSLILFRLPAVKLRAGAKRSQAAPQLTRCVDSLFPVRPKRRSRVFYLDDAQCVFSCTLL